MSEFFNQLWKFSERYAKQAGLESNESPWGYDGYKGGKPKGAVLHYTADEDFHRVLRWFCRRKYESKSSSQVVVADRKMPKHDEFAEGLPLIQKLPVTVVQCRRLDSAGWHATWTNREYYGIENVCVGELRVDGETFVTWRPRDRSAEDWTMPWQSANLSPVPLFERWWSPYSRDQVETNITILREVQDHFGSLEPAHVVGHELVQGFDTKRSNGSPMRRDKRDPGPHFPIHLVRAGVFGSDEHYMANQWMAYQDIMYGQDWRDTLVQNWATELADGSGQPTVSVAWARYRSALAAFPDRDALGSVGLVGLALLGYYFDGTISNWMTRGDVESVKLFQRLMGLSVDGDPGPNTKRALVKRLADRGILT